MDCTHRPPSRWRSLSRRWLPFLLAAVSLNLLTRGAQPPPPNLIPAPNQQLQLPKGAFGRDYLLSASIIPQVIAPTSTGLAGKIVRFELFHDGVDMYESTQGLVVTEDLPARRLLTTFPIVEQNADRVIIDFNRGMHRVFSRIWYGSPGAVDPNAVDHVLEVPQSRVFQVESQGDDLVIRQSVQARNRDANANVEQRYEVRYFLAPYVPSGRPGKEQMRSETRYARFFETSPLVETNTGRSATRIALFDVTKPIVFHYSANTPAEYVSAVRDGILYWNRAFGRDLVRAEKAPEGVTAPDSRYNLVQWVPWDSAGSAYADILIDPATGESRHGQAYMTSVFALSGKARARAALRSMRDLAATKPEKQTSGPESHTHSGDVARFGFFDGASACRIDPLEFAAQYAAGIEELLASDNLTDAAVLQAAQDYIREVVGHEVGHVLGLRHNFAGSLSADLTSRQLDDWFNDYLTGKNLDAYTNRLSSSSIMEYTPFKAAAFIGWRMRVTTTPLPHDRAAIQWGYFDAKETVEKKLLFGTDDDAGRYGDVQRFDYGDEPVIASYTEIANLTRQLPNSLIETFIAAKSPRDPRDRLPLEQVSLNVKAHAGNIANQFSSMLSWFRTGNRSLRVENQFDFIGDLNSKERVAAHYQSLTNQLDRLGGVDRALLQFLPLELKLEPATGDTNLVFAEKISAKTLHAKIVRLLDSPAYTNFVGLDEKRASFTPEEKALIIRRTQKFFEDYEREVIKQVTLRLEGATRDLAAEATGTAGESDVVSRLEQRITDLARTILVAKDDTQHIKGKVDKSLVEVVDYKFDHETRIAAAKALTDKTGSFRGWSVDAKAELNKQIKDDVDGALNIANFKDFKESVLSRPLRDWYLRQQDILALLPPKK